MTDEIETRIVKALAEQGSPEFDQPSHATLLLMDEFLEEENLQAMQRLFVACARRHPVNRAYLSKVLTGKIRTFLGDRRGIKRSALASWDLGNPGWDKSLRDLQLTSARFEARVEEIAREIPGSGAADGWLPRSPARPV